MRLGTGNHVTGLAGNLDEKVVDLLVIDGFGHLAN
jgi:hypothetical protein